MKTHHHQPLSDKRYSILFSSSPAAIKAGEKVELSFRPVLESAPGELVELETVHEMDMHLLMVSGDLSYFVHEHPTSQEDGNYNVEHIFPHGGPYILFEDFVPKGEDHQLGRQGIIVEGEPKQPLPLAEETLSWQQHGYELSIDTDNFPLLAGKPAEIKVLVKKAGEPLTDLENYLGALAHVVIISEDTSTYVHVHPMPSHTRGPEVIFHILFPQMGKYKVFFQFNHQQEVRTGFFVLFVQK